MDKLNRLSASGMTVADPAEDIRGRAVLDKAGHKLGTVHDLFLDANETKVRFLLVEHGGILGIDRKKSLVPIDAITSITADEVHVDQTLDRVAASPEYDPALVDQDRSSYSGLYNYYGYSPFWGAGYAYPAYPYYL